MLTKSIIPPLHILDGTILVASFPMRTSLILKHMHVPDELRPAEIFPGIGTVSIIVADYLELDKLDPYREFIVNVQCVPRDAPPLGPLYYLLAALKPSLVPNFGLFVDQIVVTTEQSQKVGRRVWGFPKVVGNISWIAESDRITCSVNVDGNQLVTFSFDLFRTRPGKTTSFATWSELDGTLMRGEVAATGHMRFNFMPNGARLQVHNSDMLRALNLRRPITRILVGPHAKGVMLTPEPFTP